MNRPPMKSIKGRFRKLTKTVLKWAMFGVVFVFFIVSILQIVFVYVVSKGPGRDDIALFHGNRYAISTSESNYELYERKTSRVILPNVTAYYVGKEKSYIMNHSELVIIDEKHGTYVRKPFAEATPDEIAMIEQMKQLRKK